MGQGHLVQPQKEVNVSHINKFFAQGYSTITDEETGRVYPIPAGGDGTGEEELEEESEEESEEDDDDDDDDGQNFNGETFLESIEDEELRTRLEPQVKKWDAGVTRKFQELHSRLKPYEELGEYERLNEAAQLYEILNDRPEDLYKALEQSLGKQNVQQGQPGQSQGQNTGRSPQKQAGENQGISQQQYAQLPPDVKNQLDQHNQIITTLAEHYISQERTSQQTKEDKELDDYLGNLKVEFGEFDEEYVLGKMAAGADGAKAVKQYQKSLSKYAAKQQNNSAPKILSGGGQVQQDTVNVGEISSKETKDLVAGLIAQAAQSGE